MLTSYCMFLNGNSSKQVSSFVCNLDYQHCDDTMRPKCSKMAAPIANKFSPNFSTSVQWEDQFGMAYPSAVLSKNAVSANIKHSRHTYDTFINIWSIHNYGKRLYVHIFNVLHTA